MQGGQPRTPLTFTSVGFLHAAACWMRARLAAKAAFTWSPCTLPTSNHKPPSRQPRAPQPARKVIARELHRSSAAVGPHRVPKPLKPLDPPRSHESCPLAPPRHHHPPRPAHQLRSLAPHSSSGRQECSQGRVGQGIECHHGRRRGCGLLLGRRSGGRGARRGSRTPSGQTHMSLNRRQSGRQVLQEAGQGSKGLL